MLKTQVVLLAVLISMVLAASTEAKAAPRLAGRIKRQIADVQTASYLAWIALGGKVPAHGCREIGCGVVDVVTRVRRQSADVQTSQFLAWIALGGRHNRHGCRTVGCNMVDIFSSGKRKRADGAPLTSDDINDEERYQLLKALVERAAERATSS